MSLTNLMMGSVFGKPLTKTLRMAGDDHSQIVMENISFIRRYASGIGDDIASEFRRRYE